MDELSLHEIDARLKKAENDIVEIRQAIFGADGIQVKLAAIEREGRALVIRPEEMPVSNGTLDTTKLQRAFSMGHAQLERELPKLLEFVGL